MKIKSNLKFIALFLFFTACQSSTFDADKVFPEMIGKYKRDRASRNTDTWFTAYYTKPSVEIFYGLGPAKTTEEAAKGVTDKKFCTSDDAANPGKIKILKEGILKDKTGKDNGKILICRETIKDAYKDTVGNFKYKITLANDKNYELLDGNSASLADLVDFAQALPLNSQIDFSTLDLASLIKENSSAKATADDAALFTAPLKISKEPYLNGKVLIVSQFFMKKLDTDKSFIFEKSPESYGLTKETTAESFDQADTLIKILCSKGERLGDYVTPDALKKKFPAYASNCKVSIIDKTVPAIIAEKVFIGESLSENESFSSGEKEVRASPPTIEMQEFIKKLPKK